MGERVRGACPLGGLGARCITARLTNAKMRRHTTCPLAAPARRRRAPGPALLPSHPSRGTAGPRTHQYTEQDGLDGGNTDDAERRAEGSKTPKHHSTLPFIPCVML